jgi:hypothetical protein
MSCCSEGGDLALEFGGFGSRLLQRVRLRLRSSFVLDLAQFALEGERAAGARVRPPVTVRLME